MTRTDGPALNGALAGTGALLARLQRPARRPALADRRRGRCGSPRSRSIPYALPFKRALRDRARAARAPRDGAAAAANRRGRWSGSARRCRCRCAAAPRSREVDGAARSLRERWWLGHRPTGADPARPRRPACSAPGALPRSRSALTRPRGEAGGHSAVAAARRRLGRAGRVQRDPGGRARRTPSPRTRPRWAGARLCDLQAQGRGAGRRRPGGGGARGRRARGEDPGRRQRRLVARRGGPRLTAMERHGSSWPSSRRATSRSWPRVRGADRRADRRRRERRQPRGRAARGRAGACELATVKLAKVGGIVPARAVAARAPRLPVERPRRPGGDRRGGPRRSGAPTTTARPAPARPRPRHPAPVRRHDRLGRSASCATASCTCPTVPGSASRSTSAALERATARLARGYRSRQVDPTNRNTALASAMVEELARCGRAPRGRSPPARARRRSRSRCGASRRSRSAVIVDERSAGFFALGAAQADRPARPRCSAPRAPRRRTSIPPSAEADEAAVPLIVLTADRPAGAARDRRRADDRPAEALRVGGALVLRGRHPRCRRRRAAPLPLRRLPRLRGGPGRAPARAGAPQRRLARPARARSRVRTTSRRRSPLALEGRGERPAVRRRLRATPRRGGAARRARRADRRGAAGPDRLRAPARSRPARRRWPTLAAAAGYPILAEPTSQLRLGAHDRDLVVWPYDWIARARPPALEPELVVRFGDMPTSKALRAVARRRSRPAPGRRRPGLRLERAIEAAPRRRARRAALGCRGLAEPARGGDDGVARRVDRRRAGRPRAAIDAELARRPRPPSPASTRRSRASTRDGDLVYTASSMPIRDQEGFVPAGAAGVTFLCNRGRERDRRADLVGDRRGARRRAADLGDRDRRPRPAITTSNGLAALRDVGDAGADRRPQQRRRRDLRVPAPGRRRSTATSSRRCWEPRSGSTRSRSPRSTVLPYARVVTDLGELEPPLRGTGLIEIPVDRRRNVELHGGSPSGSPRRSALRAAPESTNQGGDPDAADIRDPAGGSSPDGPVRQPAAQLHGPGDGRGARRAAGRVSRASGRWAPSS